MKGYPVAAHNVACVVDCGNKIGEGAFWCPVEGAVYWLDVVQPSAMYRLLPNTGKVDRWEMPDMITAMAKRKDGSLLVASENGLNYFDPKVGKLVRVAEPESHKPLNRSNDCAPDAKGRFWMGTMQNNLRPDGSEIAITEASGELWRIDADLRATPVISGLNITNGVAWSPDWRTLYVIDTMIQTIFAYDFDLEAGTVSNRRVFSDIKDMGYPDGSAVDREGYLWNARWESGCVMRFAPDGSVDRVVPIPAWRVTSCAFGGEDLGTLYVTTARFNADEALLERYPKQGGLFAFTPGIRGLPRPLFGG